MVEVEADLALSSENHTTPPTIAPKLRSCVVCRSRKVRCDKQSPCANCRHANIACVFPTTDRPPRWARRFKHVSSDASASYASVSQDTHPDTMNLRSRLQDLEQLVKRLKVELAQAQAAAAGTTNPGSLPSRNATDDGNTGRPDRTMPTIPNDGVDQMFGRLVSQDASSSHYISSGFWSRVTDELDGLDIDALSLASDESNGLDDTALPEYIPSTQPSERTPRENHAFLFGHNLSPLPHDLHEFHPLPSQIPFLVNVFAENVNFIFQAVHVPTINKLVREMRSSGARHLMAANEALLFSIYYAAIAAMEEEDVMTNFGSAKFDLLQRYRLGLEHALAKADFLNSPDMTLVQALGIFVCLLRRHDSPRLVWMMTGLLIRMAQYLGLQRDGTHFKHLTCYEIEMRRRVWWALCMLDARASEDQGTDLTIPFGSFDTKVPSNIDDADISPETKDMPVEREGLTDMSFALWNIGLFNVQRKLISLGFGHGEEALEEQKRLLNEIHEQYETSSFVQTKSDDIADWVGKTVARLVHAKMTLLVFLPTLFSSPSDRFSNEVRTKLLVSAIEVAECNHALNTEQAARHWRWIFQIYTHWYSVVYLLMECSRRPWSPIVERAWIALHSSWLIPAETHSSKRSRIWIPVRKLMVKARKHRDSELERLRANTNAAVMLYHEDQEYSLPSSPGYVSTGLSGDMFRERWSQLVHLESVYDKGKEKDELANQKFADPLLPAGYASQSTEGPLPPSNLDAWGADMRYGRTVDGAQEEQVQPKGGTKQAPSTELPTAPNVNSTYNNTTTGLDGLSNGRTMGPSLVPWLWADTDPAIDVFAGLDMDLNSMDVNMDFELDSEMDWNEWVKSANRLEPYSM